MNQNKRERVTQIQREVVMKKIILIVAAIAIVLAMAGGAYAASISPTVSVTGTVSGICKAGTAGVMAFSIPDPSAPGPISATVTDATVFCTNTSAFTVTAASLNKGGAAATCASPGGITGTLKDASANVMNYTFTCGTAGGTGQGFGAGKDRALSLAGSIASAAYINAAASSTYADTVTLTITY
jgi:spore coat protein U-like protein